MRRTEVRRIARFRKEFASDSAVEIGRAHFDRATEILRSRFRIEANLIRDSTVQMGRV